MTIRFLLVLFILEGFLIIASTGCHKSSEAALDPAEGIAALRQEVAALREEVAQLRRGNPLRTVAAGSSGEPIPDMSSGGADLMEQLSSMREKLAASQREVASNLVQITVARGSDAWRRGDFKEALRLLKPAAEGGDPIAAHRLGVMAVLGQGGAKDSAEAIKWFSVAAEQGQGESQHSLGLRYLWGDGIEKNPENAAAWFTAAANQGIPDSATWLADMYWNGSGVVADPVEAYKWMILSGDKFNINHRNGVTIDQFAAQLTAQQKAEAEQRAHDFVPQRIGPEDF